MKPSQTFRLRIASGQHVVDATLVGRLGTTAKLSYDSNWGYFDPYDGSMRGGDGLALGTCVVAEDLGTLQAAVRLLGTAESTIEDKPATAPEVKTLDEMFWHRAEELSGLSRAILQDITKLRQITWEQFLKLRSAFETLFTEIGVKDLFVRLEDLHEDLDRTALDEKMRHHEKPERPADPPSAEEIARETEKEPTEEMPSAEEIAVGLTSKVEEVAPATESVEALSEPGGVPEPPKPEPPAVEEPQPAGEEKPVGTPPRKKDKGQTKHA